MFTDYIFLEKFKSKKNSVHLISCKDNLYVLKKYKDIYKKNKEEEILRLLYNENLNTPKIVMENEDSLVLEYINGITLTDWLLTNEININNKYDNLIISLVKWIYNYDQLIEKCYPLYKGLGDVNLRNFLVSNDEIYGVDFEDVGGGCIEQDISGIILYILTYDPPYTQWKIGFAQKFYQYSQEIIPNLDKGKIIKYLNKWKIIFEKRRNTEIFIDNILEIVSKCW